MEWNMWRHGSFLPDSMTSRQMMHVCPSAISSSDRSANLCTTSRSKYEQHCDAPTTLHTARVPCVGLGDALVLDVVTHTLIQCLVW